MEVTCNDSVSFIVMKPTSSLYSFFIPTDNFLISHDDMNFNTCALAAMMKKRKRKKKRKKRKRENNK